MHRARTGPDLLRVDDVLLRASAWTGSIWVLGSAAGLSAAAQGSTGVAGTLALVLLAASAPLALLAAGLRLRRRERRAWALHRLVDDHVEIPASDLLRASDFTAATLDRAIRDLNNAGVAFLVWDRESDVVQDGRLRRAHVQLEVCGSCGAKISLSVRIGQGSAPRCPYCHGPVGDERLFEEKARLIEELDSDPEAVLSREGRSFSVAIFLVLMVVFWPLAVGYAFWHWRAGQAAF